MSNSILAIALTVTLGQFPLGGGPISPGGGGPATIPFNVSSGVGAPATGVLNAPNSTGAFNSGDQLYPFDAPENWMHGHFQEIPAYGGYHFFRPYNYKHILAQAQVAGGWGMSPVMPYSQEYFRRAHNEQAKADPRSQASSAMAYAPNATAYAAAPQNPTGQPQGTRVDELTLRVQQQEQQLRQLHQALQDEYNRAYPTDASILRGQ